jgi:uncharacterized cupin superfamily protein
MASQRGVTVWPPAEGRALAWTGIRVVYKAVGEETGGRYCLNETTSPPGFPGPPPHLHTREDEGFYLLDGEVTFVAGDRTVQLPPGSYLNAAQGTAHYFHPPADRPASYLVVAAPAGFDRFQFEAGAALPSPQSPVPPATPADFERLTAAAPRYGIDLAPPTEAFQKPPRMTLTRPGEGKRISVVGDVYRFLATGEDTGGAYAILEATVAPGGGPPLHRHSREDEGFFVLDGEITFTVVDRQVKAAAGTFVNLPPGVKHAFKNEGGRVAKMLILVAPAGFEKMFEETGVALTGPDAPGLPPTREEIEKLLGAAPRYGVEILEH